MFLSVFVVVLPSIFPVVFSPFMTTVRFSSPLTIDPAIVAPFSVSVAGVAGDAVLSAGVKMTVGVSSSPSTFDALVLVTSIPLTTKLYEMTSEIWEE